mmetsp:Transcript_2911/g.6064  ORF Transcript_2911/g.6064 Transcript_2911/m.6064 type:complete len:295 (-) Transcript_2911:2000-2884(-)
MLFVHRTRLLQRIRIRIRPSIRLLPRMPPMPHSIPAETPSNENEWRAAEEMALVTPIIPVAASGPPIGMKCILRDLAMHPPEEGLRRLISMAVAPRTLPQAARNAVVAASPAFHPTSPSTPPTTAQPTIPTIPPNQTHQSQTKQPKAAPAAKPNVSNSTANASPPRSSAIRKSANANPVGIPTSSERRSFWPGRAFCTRIPWRLRTRSKIAGWTRQDGAVAGRRRRNGGMPPRRKEESLATPWRPPPLRVFRAHRRRPRARSSYRDDTTRLPLPPPANAIRPRHTIRDTRPFHP